MHVIIAVVYIIASVTQGATGFGFGIISLPLVSLILNPEMTVGINAILGPVNCVYNYYLLRKYVDYRDSVQLFFLSAAFIPIGAYVLVTLNEHMIFILMGLLIISITIRSLVGGKNRKNRAIHPYSRYVFPGITGLVAGAFASPGPVMAPFMFAYQKDPYVAKANLQFIFSLMNILIISSHIVTGNLNGSTALFALPYIPVVFAFTKLGSYLSFKVKKETFIKIVNSALLLLGSYILIRNIYLCAL